MSNKQKNLMPPPKNQVPQIEDDDDEMDLSEDEEGSSRVDDVSCIYLLLYWIILTNRDYFFQDLHSTASKTVLFTREQRTSSSDLVH